MIVFMLSLFLIGCSPPLPSSISKSPINLPDIKQYNPTGTLNLALGGEVSILNPILSSDSTSSAVEGVIFSGMLRFDKHLQPKPDVAERWTTSADGKIWIFYLKKNVFWHDGHPFDAQDVKFTFDSILNPRVNSVRRSDYIIDGIPIQFKVIDKYTIQAILPKPFAPFLPNAAMGILPEHILAGKDLNRADFNRHPIGTGPFKLQEWRPGNFLIVQRNERYFGRRPRLAKIVYKIIPDENSRLIVYEAGEIDAVDIPPKDYRRARELPRTNVFEYETLLYTYLGLNLADPIFSDVNVRRALSHAVNKAQLVSLVLKGLGLPADLPNAPVSWAYSDAVVKYAYSPEQSRRLLDRAGYKRGADGYYAKNGKRLEFTVLINQGNKERQQAAIILQQQFKKVGVKMEIKVLEWSALLRVVNAPTDPKDFDAVLMGWSLGIDPDSYSIWHSSQYPRGLNFIRYNNPKADKLLEAGRTELNQAKRKAVYAKLYRQITADAPYVFLWYPTVVMAVSRRVGGIDPNPGPAGVFLDAEDVFVVK
jgi:peptide/nickel transport system substrate-binding protein